MVELSVIGWIWIVGYYVIIIAFLIWMLTYLEMWKDLFPKVKVAKKVAKTNRKIFDWKA